jgi:hypothetical protein
MRKVTVIVLLLVGTASADTTYQVDPESRIDKPTSKTHKQCDDATKASLAAVVRATSHIRLAGDGVYYKLVGGDFRKATTSVDNYGFIKSSTSTVVLAVFPAKLMDSAHASERRSEVMIAVIRRGKSDCAERWFGFAKAVQP